MAAAENPRPLVVEIEWTEDGEAKREIFGPWTPAADDSHLSDLTRFVKGWHERTGITPKTVTMWVCEDPGDYLADPHPDGVTGNLSRELSELGEITGESFQAACGLPHPLLHPGTRIAVRMDTEE